MTGVVDFIGRSLNFGPQFLRRNRIGTLPVEERRGTNRTDRFVYHCFVRAIVHGTVGVQTHYLTVEECFINIIKN